MNVAIIDADLLNKKRRRPFPNLASMKLSAYNKSIGNDVTLKTSYENLDEFDKVYISKVFTQTYVDPNVMGMDNVVTGGTGFYYDKAEPLPGYIEHIMPDYHLYDQYIEEMVANGRNVEEYKNITDYSYGFLTRGCFRKCAFCVNQNHDRAVLHSPIEEFDSPERKKIYLLDDNFFSYKDWKELLQSVIDRNKKFKFAQGIDERILNEEKCEMLFSCKKYDGSFTFAFDDYNDKDIIEDKLKLICKYDPKRNLKFYVLCGFDRHGAYDDEFWINDIVEMFERIRILMKYNAAPYIMRYEKYEDSPYRGIYITAAEWCNPETFFRRTSIREFAERKMENGRGMAMKYLESFEKQWPEVASKYFDMKLSDIVEYNMYGTQVN